MQCEREDAMFMGVSLMVRLVSPRNSCRKCSPVIIVPRQSYSHPVTFLDRLCIKPAGAYNRI